MFLSRFLAQAAVSLVLVLRANAETHTITFINNCGHGSPALIENGVNILSGNSYTSQGPWSGIGYLQTGSCGLNGENCVLLETTLIDPTCAGCGSSTDLSMIPPHAYNVETSFAYYGGCNGQGKTCSSASCPGDAFYTSTDWSAQVACQTNNVNLLVSFCAPAAQFVNSDGTINLASNPVSATSSPVTSSTPASTYPTSTSPTSTSPASTPSTSSTPASTSPASTYLTPSSAASSGSSTPGSVSPTTSPTSPTPSTTPTPSATQPSAGTSSLGCGETESTTPSSTPTPSEATTPATTPTSTPTSTPSTPAGSAPGSPSASSPARPTSSQRCIPRSTGLTGSNSAPTGPASSPTYTYTPTDTPLTTDMFMPITSASAGTETNDPCDTGSTSTPTSTPYQRRRHHRANRIRY